MKKGKIIFKDNKYMIRYLDTYSGKDNGGFERWFEIEVNPEFSIDILEYLLRYSLNEELEFEKFWYVYEYNGCKHGKYVANINLSVVQSRDIKINQIIENK